MGSDRAKRSRADQTGEHAGEPLLIRLSNRPVLLSLLRSPPLLSRGGETSKPREGDPRIRISRHDFSSPFEEDRASRGIGVDHPRTRFPFCPPPPLIGPPVCIKRQVGCALSADRPARPHESKVERNKLGRRVDIEGGKNSSRGARARAIDRPRSTIAPRASTDPRLLPRVSLCPADPLREPSTTSTNSRTTALYDYRRSSFQPRRPSFLPSFLSFFLRHRPRYRVRRPSEISLLLLLCFLEFFCSSRERGRERERDGSIFEDPPPSSPPSPRTRPSTAV